MKNISFAIIGHNEAYLLKGCLESIKDIADEIVYVDCESSDDSIDVVKEYGARIFQRRNDYNININKQFAIDNCKSEWIFYIDPDERLTKDVKDEILSVIKENKFDAFLIPRRNYYFGKWLKYGGKYPDKQLRLFKNGKARFECISIHERVKIDGKIGELKNPFEHVVVENTDRLVLKMGSYIYRGGYDVLRRGIRPEKVLLRSLRNFFRNYFLKMGFLDGKIGLFVALLDLFNGFLYYFKAKELER